MRIAEGPQFKLVLGILAEILRAANGAALRITGGSAVCLADELASCEKVRLKDLPERAFRQHPAIDSPCE